jgi:hypothetical protein
LATIKGEQEVRTDEVVDCVDEMRRRIRALTGAVSVALLGAVLASLAVAPILSVLFAAVLVGWCQLPSL